MKPKQTTCIRSMLGITWGHKYTIIYECDTGFRVLNDLGDYRWYKKTKFDDRSEVDVEKMVCS